MADIKDFDYDVVVCGYGPAGQAATSLLSRKGHKVVAFDKHSALYGQPRLCTIDGETVRILGTAGDLDHAMRISSVCEIFDLCDADGQLLARVDWTAPHPSGHPRRVSFFQPDIEDAMDEAARANGAEVNLGWAVTGIEQDTDGVTATVTRRVEGELRADETRTIRARYLLGSDGAKSFAREAIGAEREDFGYREAFLSIDVKRKHDLGGRFMNPAATCDPGRTIASIPMGPERIRFEFIANPDDDHTHLMVPEVGYRMLEEAYGLTEDDVEIYRQVIYPFEGKLTYTWRAGRVLLAGDAAHLMPPFQGQGACSALRDAINASWKLDLVLRGISDDALLDSYQLERREHVKVHVLGSIALAQLACERDPEKAAERNELYRTGKMPPPPEDPVLLDGVLHRDEAGAIALPAGELAPQDVVEFNGQRGRFDDVFGWGFQLLARGQDPMALLNQDQKDFLASIDCSVVEIGDEPAEGVAHDVEGAYARYFDHYGVEAVLARPDFWTFGGARSVEDIPALVDDLSEQLHAHVGVGAGA
jgi:3-(3-hydroxy-phenyl)propionate hydroxylase